jgi:hypothetical protein
VTAAPAAIPGRAKCRVEFRVATRADDAELRRLLREAPMAGDIRLSFEREPSYFAAAGIDGPEHQTVVAVEDGRVVCAGSASARLRYVNGRPVRVGYLGGLRLDAAHRNRISIIRRGYDLFRKLHEGGGDGAGGGPPLYLSSIVADNLPARRLLERGLPGMPTYHFLGEFVTLVDRRRGNNGFLKPRLLVRRLREMGLSLEYGADAPVAELAGLLNCSGGRYQFAPAWTVEDLSSRARCPGLTPEDFRLARSADGTPVACAALWDQQSVKQTVVRGYSPRLRRLRPLLNLAAAVRGRPKLPAVPQPIRHAFVSHVVTPPEQPQLVEWFVRLLHGPARTRKIDYLTLGFDARDPRLALLRKAFRPREYVSRLYAVYWGDEGAELARSLDGRLLAPEVALL